MSRRLLVTVVLVIAVFLSGCGDDDASPRGDAGPTTTSPTEVIEPADTGGASDGDAGSASSGGPGTERVGVQEKVTVRVLDEDGEVVAGEGR